MHIVLANMLSQLDLLLEESGHVIRDVATGAINVVVNNIYIFVNYIYIYQTYIINPLLKQK